MVFRASGPRDPSRYVGSIRKLEKAMELLEKAHSQDQALLQQVSAALFWARKFSTIHTSASSYRPRHAHEPDPSASSAQASPSKTDTRTKPVEPEPVRKKNLTPEERAHLAFEAAGKLEAGAKPGDLFVIMRWLQIAEEFSKTSYAQRARERANAVRKNFERTYGGADKSPEESVAVKLMLEADALLKAGEFKKAFDRFRLSIDRTETIVARRKLGHAYFKYATSKKNEIMPKFDEVKKEYDKAYKGAQKSRRGRRGRVYKFVDWNHPPLVAAKRKGQDLQNEANKIFGIYHWARKEFQRIVELMPANLDLDAEAHVAFCYSVQTEVITRSKARALLNTILKTYRPLDAEEQQLYERCKQEFERVTGKKGASEEKKARK